MRSSNNSIQWGKLTSLDPDFKNIPLLKHPSSLAVSREGLQEFIDENLSSKRKCQIYQKKGEVFLSFTGSRLSVEVDEKTVKEGEPSRVHSGDRIVFIHKKIRMKYIFSRELIQKQKETLKRDREEQEDFLMLKRKMRFEKKLKKEMICGICEKMIYECTSVVPCLHRFCMHCLLKHLQEGQECPQCGERFIEFRKDTFFNNLIEAYEESGNRKDRSQEECKEVKERLETERVWARFEYVNGGIYEDEWKKCRKDGRGKMIWNDRNVYEGDWRSDQREGKGRMIYRNGDIYEGDWKKSKKEGRGLIKYHSGDIYEGDWKEDKKEGQGKMIYNYGDVYEGSWRNNLFHGRGKMLYKNGNIYEGDWKDDQKEGHGKMIYNEGRVYEGRWKGDLSHGKGKMTFDDGTVYEGDWENGSMNGKGEMKYANGNIYEGDWRGHKMEGEGKMIFASGEIYEGAWEDGKRNGHGKFVRLDGIAYFGDWKDDLF